LSSATQDWRVSLPLCIVQVYRALQPVSNSHRQKNPQLTQFHIFDACDVDRVKFGGGGEQCASTAFKHGSVKQNGSQCFHRVGVL
jgi:hypothetical protein